MDEILKTQIKEYLKENMTISIKQPSYGFNQTTFEIHLKLEGETISQDWFDIPERD